MEYVVLLLAYLVGSIPFGLVLSRMAGLGDITKQGSGNIGATNVLRVGGRKLGLMTLLLDAGKGAVMVLLARQFFPEYIVLLVAALVVIGHVFPIWLKFKGGKGVATTLAVLLSVYWPVGVFACLVWLCAFSLMRISSVAALASMILAPFFALYIANLFILFLTLFLSLLVIIRHHENIRRLLEGTEKRSDIKK